MFKQTPLETRSNFKKLLFESLFFIFLSIGDILVSRNFFHNTESGSFVTLVYFLHFQFTKPIMLIADHNLLNGISIWLK